MFVFQRAKIAVVEKGLDLIQLAVGKKLEDQRLYTRVKNAAEECKLTQLAKARTQRNDLKVCCGKGPHLGDITQHTNLWPVFAGIGDIDMRHG